MEPIFKAAGDHVGNTFFLVGVQNTADIVARGANARQVWRCFDADFVLQVEHSLECTIACGPAGAEGDGKETWFVFCQQTCRLFELCNTFRRLWREEFEAVCRCWVFQ